MLNQDIDDNYILRNLKRLYKIRFGYNLAMYKINSIEEFYNTIPTAYVEVL